jgi:uncharacterized protein (DUF362 family)
LFTKINPKDWLKAEQGWLDPKVQISKYKKPKEVRARPLKSLGSGKTMVHLARVGRKDPISSNYASSYLLTKKLFEDEPVDGSKILLKPNNTGFVGVFYNSPLCRPILKRNKIVTDPDLQPIATQPAIIIGAIDALLDMGAGEVNLGETMLWEGGTPRAFLENGYTRVLSKQEYEGKVFFIDLYDDKETLVEHDLETRGNDLGFFLKTRIPESLLEEKYDYLLNAPIAKMHNNTMYTLTVKNSSIGWNPKGSRWHAHGMPFEYFDGEKAGEAFGFSPDPELTYEVLRVRKLDEKKSKEVIVTNGKESTSPMKAYREEGKWLLQVDPHHLEGNNLVTLIMAMSYVASRAASLNGTVHNLLEKNGTKTFGLLSGIVGQEGEGPLIFGSRKYGGFAAASKDPVALEAAGINVMTGWGNQDWPARMISVSRDFGKKFDCSSDALVKDSSPPWWIKLASDLTGGEWDYRKLSYDLMDLDGKGAVRKLWDVRRGAPFKLPWGVFCRPKTWIKMMFTEEGIHRNSMRFFQKDIDIPLIPGVTLV